ncbi:nectin-3-like protein isoform X2 [Arapaima gigas]
MDDLHGVTLCCSVSLRFARILTAVVFFTDPSEKRAVSSVTVAGAAIGAVLALFLTAVVAVVILSSRKASRPIYLDKVIELPPTHKPPPPYSERPVAVPLAAPTGQEAEWQLPSPQPRRGDQPTTVTENMATRSTRREARGPICRPLSYREWMSHRSGEDRVYINHREHYV